MTGILFFMYIFVAVVVLGPAEGAHRKAPFSNIFPHFIFYSMNFSMLSLLYTIPIMYVIFFSSLPSIFRCLSSALLRSRPLWRRHVPLRRGIQRTRMRNPSGWMSSAWMFRTWTLYWRRMPLWTWTQGPWLLHTWVKFRLFSFWLDDNVFCHRNLVHIFSFCHLDIFFLNCQSEFFLGSFEIFSVICWVIFSADCIDPSCSDHGTCITGQCYCK